MKTFIAEKPCKLSKATFLYCNDISFAEFSNALKKKDVKVNGKRVNSDITLREGDRVDIYYSPVVKELYSVLYKDDNILVINKYPFFTSEQVFEKLLKEYQCVGFVHRLDRNTDGIMVFSLNDFAQAELEKGFKEHAFIKEYTATVFGTFNRKKAVLEGYLLKDQTQSTVKIFDKKINGGAYIKTGYQVIEENGETSVLKVRLYTGKTHQIRAHLAYVGHPIVGDGKYGDNKLNKKLKANRQLLTATSLTLIFSEDNPLNYLNKKTFTI